MSPFGSYACGKKRSLLSGFRLYDLGVVGNSPLKYVLSVSHSESKSENIGIMWVKRES